MAASSCTGERGVEAVTRDVRHSIHASPRVTAENNNINSVSTLDVVNFLSSGGYFESYVEGRVRGVGSCAEVVLRRPLFRQRIWRRL